MISPITLTIIGTGPGAVAAALRARKLGIKVTILEQEHPLQRCQSWYEITFQALLKSAMKYENISKCGAYGLKAEGIHFDLDAIMERSRASQTGSFRESNFSSKSTRLSIAEERHAS